MQIFYQPFIRKHSYLGIWYHSWQSSTQQLQTLRFMPQGGARGQIKGQLNFFFDRIIYNLTTYTILSYFLSVTSDLRVHDQGLG